MKHARKALVFLILLVTPLLLAGVLPPAIDNEVEATISPITTKVNAPSYDVQTPILAYSDFDMDNYASDLSWDGDGSSGDPYIIEGYNITDDGDCLLMWDVTRAFKIRNCYISSITSLSGNGIIIYNVTQAAVIDTVIRDKSDAMIVSHTPSPYFDNCTIYDCGTGLDMGGCPGATINDCHIYDIFGEAIRFIDCNNTMISENEIHDTVIGSGIQFHLSYDVIVVNNEISYCESSGVWVVNSPYATIENNIIHDNDFFTGPMCGVQIESSPHASIVGNEIYDNSRNGIYVQESDFVYIFDNEIYGNSDHGIDVMFCINGTILQNDIHGNGWSPELPNALCGIFLGPSYNYTISDNMIWNNTPSGISLETAEDVVISNNDIFNNTDTGIYGNSGETSYDVTIYHNRIHGNGYSFISPHGRAGILIFSYSNVIVENNLLYNNFDYGISIQGDDNFIIGNEVYDTGGYGVGIGTEESYHNLLSENIVHHNEVGIFVVNVQSNITHNIVYDNDYGIYMEWSGFCRIYGNDVGWNSISNAFEINTIEGQPLLWDDNVSIGNHWSDYDGGGIYWIWNATHGVTPDRFPSISLNLTVTDAISYEILETGNVLVWEAYALNPAYYDFFVDGVHMFRETWDGGDIEINVDGLPHGINEVQISVVHVSGYGMGNTVDVDVEDLTSPSEIEGPAHISIGVGLVLSAQYTSEDPSGITWSVNNTEYFDISSTGLLTGADDLPVGDYSLRIVALDPYGHSTFLEITVTVVPEPNGGLPTSLILAIGGGGAIVILVIVAIGYKTKKG